MKSPEGRTGRARSPRRAVAAPQSRASAVSEAVEAAERVTAARAASAGLIPGAMPPAQPGPSQPTIAGAAVPPPGVSIEVIEEMAVDAAGDMDPLTKVDPWGKISSSSTGLPGGIPVLPGAPFVLHNPHGLLHDPHVGAAGRLGTPLAEVKNRSEAARSALRGLVGPQQAPPMPGSTVLEPTNADLMNKLDKQSELMTALLSAVALKEDVRAAQIEVEEKIDAVDTKLGVRLDKVESRMDKFEANPGAKGVAVEDDDTRLIAMMDATDRAFQRIAVMGFDNKDTEDFRVERMVSFMQEHFPEDKYKTAYVGHIKRGPHDKRVLTDVGFIEFFDKEIRDEILKKIQANKAKFSLKNGSGNALTFNRARLKSQSKRYSSLMRAKDLIKKKYEGQGKKIEHTTELPTCTVTVNGVTAFTQDYKSQFKGTFCGDCADLHL